MNVKTACCAGALVVAMAVGCGRPLPTEPSRQLPLESSAASPASATTAQRFTWQTQVAPNAPSGLTVTVNGSTVVLNWIAPVAGDPATSFVIEAGSASGGADIVSFDTTLFTTTFTAMNVPSGTYFVRVRARNGSGVSGPSNEGIVLVGVTPCSPPPAPAGLGYSVQISRVTMFWNSVPGATSYVLEAGSSRGLANLANFDTGNTMTSFTALGVPPGDYYVRVRAKNACAVSSVSNEVVPRVCQPPLTSCPGPPP